MKKIYRIGRIGTKHVTVEEAEDERSACYKAGWAPAWCVVQDITEEVTKLKESGDMEAVKGAP